MPSDIVQVIDRAIELAELTNSKCPGPGLNGCFKCSQRTTDMAQLRALRRRIEGDRKAHAEYQQALTYGWDRSNGRPAAFDIALDTERTLLAFCREEPPR